MATRQKSRPKMLFSARSEMKKGFTMPTIKKIKSVLRSRSKTFLVNLIISMMAGMSKTAKIKILIKIEKGKVIKRAIKKRRKAKSTRAGKKTTKSKGRKGKGFQGKPKGSKAEKAAMKNAQRARKRS